MSGAFAHVNAMMIEWHARLAKSPDRKKMSNDLQVQYLIREFMSFGPDGNKQYPSILDLLGRLEGDDKDISVTEKH